MAELRLTGRFASSGLAAGPIDVDEHLALLGHLPPDGLKRLVVGLVIDETDDREVREQREQAGKQRNA